MTLSSTPTAIKAAAKCFVELIVHESDNNVKLVVLDKLIKLQHDHKHDLALQVCSLWTLKLDISTVNMVFNMVFNVVSFFRTS